MTEPKRRPGQECGDAVGTVVGYSRHRRKEQQPCTRCQQAWAEYSAGRRETHRQEPPLPPQHFVHGTIYGYNTRGCRCEACKAAIVRYQKDRAERIKESGLPANSPLHGKFHAYNTYGCRCPKCRDAGIEYRRQKREGRP